MSLKRQCLQNYAIPISNANTFVNNQVDPISEQLYPNDAPKIFSPFKFLVMGIALIGHCLFLSADMISSTKKCVPEVRVFIVQILYCSLQRSVILKKIMCAPQSVIASYGPAKLSLVNLISKDTNLVFYLSSDYEVIFDFCVDSASLATSFKKCNIIMT